MAALGGSISKRYARALFSIGVDRNSFEQLGAELTALADLYHSSTELRDALDNPVFKNSEKHAILQNLVPRVAPSTELRSFALLLFERGRLAFLPHIAREFRKLSDEKLGQVRGKLTSAAPLDAEGLARIQKALEGRLGKKVILETQVDPELLGGVVTQVEDLVLDGSLRTRLEALSNRILN